MNPGVSGNVKFFYYLIEGMVGVCFYGEVFRIKAFAHISRLRIRQLIRLVNSING